MSLLADHLAGLTGPAEACHAPFGADVRILAAAAARRGGRGGHGGRGGLSVYVARDDRQAAAALRIARFFSPDLASILLPAWDCLPYDRASPSASIAARRSAHLVRLARRLNGIEADLPLLVITTVSSLTQRTAPVADMAGAVFSARTGDSVDRAALEAFLSVNGYGRAPTAREPGDYAIRGGIVDIFPPDREEAMRLDFFGDKLESVRLFDPESQKSCGRTEDMSLATVSEIFLDDDRIERFRIAYSKMFGSPRGDGIYETLLQGGRPQGMEHYLPLFYARTETVFAYLGADPLIGLDGQAENAAAMRHEQTSDYYQARASAAGEDGAHVLAPDRLYLGMEDLQREFEARTCVRFQPHDGDHKRSISLRALPGRNFAPERAGTSNVFDALATHVRALRKEKKAVLFAAWSAGSAVRLKNVFADHDLPVVLAPDWSAARGAMCLAELPIDSGFVSDDLAVISEQDILGDRMARSKPRRSAAKMLFEAASLAPGDLVVHTDHGVGRFAGLCGVRVEDAVRDCLELIYAGGDKVFLPVENIELLTRYGADSESIALDRLGGAAWQARKARARKKILDMAEDLIRVAAARKVRKAPVILPPPGEFDEFCVRFPHEETDDQLRAVDEILSDLGAGRPADRLICGDVGFGKTEIALRAAFATMMSGYQVALIAPTTILARQHFQTATERFSNWPIQVARLSRLVGSGEAALARANLASGVCDMVVGTHAVLSGSVAFKRLGLLVVDEEQRFGVRHKERMKEMKTDLHVLTLSATPIPRTLQGSLSGIRDLSLITTPPADRLSVRTYLVTFDPLTLREALLRERYRGGQAYVVVPRISDLSFLEGILREKVPEVDFLTVHGQMAPGQLDDIMSRFHDGRADVLLATSIVESGLDIARANTLVVYRADMFGLAQLYQLRGRVGRAKLRAYAYFTISDRKPPTESALKRLHLIKSLDSLGAGFTLAGHDLDMRGGGNLLGDEQSGHIREVGAELYQHMVEEAVNDARGTPEAGERDWSPRIDIGATALIPESYVRDLSTRLSLYRRLSTIDEDEERDSFAVELIDRFGPLPDETDLLLSVSRLKAQCKRIGVAEIQAGAKGVVIGFRDDARLDVAALVDWVSRHADSYRLRPDSRLVCRHVWPEPGQRLSGMADILASLDDHASPAGGLR